MYPDMVTRVLDLRHLTWSVTRQSSGTAGSFLKAYEERGGRKRYFKLSSFDAFQGITGHECVNELIADRLLTRLGIPHLSYTLIHANVQIDGADYCTWLCASDDFKEPGESKTAFDVFFQMERLTGESAFAFCGRKGWKEWAEQILLVDYLVLNRDRHGGNIEILQNRSARTVCPAPLFDHGLSLMCSCHEEEALAKFDVMEDRPVQSFLGSRSARKNLELISADFWEKLGTLREKDLDAVLEGLEEVLTETHLLKIRDMLKRRWDLVESIRNS